jgi:hypothetical protein
MTTRRHSHVPSPFPAISTTSKRERLAEVAERTPVTLAVRSGTPFLTTFTSIQA